MSAGSTVLIVDDDPSIRLVCRLNLELDGYRVLESGSVHDARAALASDAVDVLLLDVRVGADDGLAFLDEVRRERPALPVAMLTGSTDPAELLEARADAVIGKPFELDELKRTVGSLATRRR